MKNQQNTRDDTYDFPYDVLENILSRLPVKSILRFKTVCKSWNAVMEDPSFAGTHSKRSNISNSRCFFTDYDGEDAYSLIKFDGHEFYRVSVGRFQLEENSNAYFLCGCEGILVFQLHIYIDGRSCYRVIRERKFVLLNPFTRNRSTFSCPNDHVTNDNGMCICYSDGCGIFFDKYEDDYKFIALLRGGKYCVYSFKNDSWVERQRERGGYCVVREGTCVNGVVYWVVSNGSPVSNGGIVYFDPKDDSLKKLHVPEDLRTERFRLTNLRGNLCLYNRDKESVIGIWLLKEDEQEHEHGGRWMKIATVDNKLREEFDPELFFAYSPLYLTSENKVVFQNPSGMRYAVYHPDRKKFGEIKKFKWGCRMIGFPCLESLNFPAIRRERWHRDQVSSSSGFTRSFFHHNLNF